MYVYVYIAVRALCVCHRNIYTPDSDRAIGAANGEEDLRHPLRLHSKDRLGEGRNSNGSKIVGGGRGDTSGLLSLLKTKRA